MSGRALCDELIASNSFIHSLIHSLTHSLAHPLILAHSPLSHPIPSSPEPVVRGLAARYAARVVPHPRPRLRPPLLLLLPLLLLVPLLLVVQVGL
jgi:hypothetical protein